MRRGDFFAKHVISCLKWTNSMKVLLQNDVTLFMMKVATVLFHSLQKLC